MRSIFLTKYASEPNPDPVRKTFQGIDIDVEWPKGSVRTGTSPDGEPWERHMKSDYGYVPGTIGKDGDGEDLDIYLGDDPDATEAYLVEQLDQDGNFDEYKCLLGFSSEEEALENYASHYPSNWSNLFGEVWSTPVSRLKEMIDEHIGGEKRHKEARFLREDELRELGRQYLKEHPELRTRADAYNAKYISQ